MQGDRPPPPQQDQRAGPADAPSHRPTLGEYPHNLPTQLTSFIGRAREIADVARLLSNARLVTLIGAPGVGKTRLALQVAGEVLGDPSTSSESVLSLSTSPAYPDGVWLVEFAAIAEPTLVPQAVVSALGVREEPGRPLAETLSGYLRPRSLLLVLDNCEHLVGACAALADGLLRACPQLRILATSREVLGIAGEIAWRVPSLAVPDPRPLPPIESLTQYEAVRLFVERAAAALPSFRLTDRNAEAVAQVCRRLDGIPLAIELAATRARGLAMEQIAVRLDDRFRLLSGGSRTALPRYQTLRALVDWSHDLLSARERVLLRRLAVFAGGWTLDAAEGICSGDGIEASDVLDTLLQLVDKSLVLAEEQGAEERYRSLETIREYGLEQLGASGELPSLRRRHAEFFSRFAENIGPRLLSAEQLVYLDGLEREHDNLRAALAWCREDVRGAELGLQLAAAVWWFWHHRSYPAEGRGWLDGALAAAEGLPPTGERAEALIGAGVLAFNQNENAAARARLQEALEIGRHLGDRRAAGQALTYLGILAVNQDRDLETASRLHAESAVNLREAGDTWTFALNLSRLGMVARLRGDYAGARALAEESAALFGETGERFGLGHALLGLGQAALEAGDPARADRWFRAALPPLKQLGMRLFIDGALLGLAAAACARGDYGRAARLLGASDAARERVGAPVYAGHRAAYDLAVATLGANVDDETFTATWSEGRAMSLEQAVAYALAAGPPTQASVTGAEGAMLGRRTCPLTGREQEVAALIARGLTNRQIAEELVIAERTAHAHVGNILGKLGFASRAQVAAWAVEQGVTAAPPG